MMIAAMKKTPLWLVVPVSSLVRVWHMVMEEKVVDEVVEDEVVEDVVVGDAVGLVQQLVENS